MTRGERAAKKQQHAIFTNVEFITKKHVLCKNKETAKIFFIFDWQRRKERYYAAISKI
ncbi:MAG: hypothetical protein K1W23_02740 [Lachnospiraceae bacterium]